MQSLRHSCAIQAVAAAFLFGLPVPGGTTSVVTFHYNNARTGWNNTETSLTAANVQSASFGLLYQVSLDEQVDAQPLFMPGQMIAGQGVHDVVYVATEADSIYAIDANNGAILLQRSLGTAVPQTALPSSCGNNSSNIGVASTPVIDPASSTLYAIAATYSVSGGSPIISLVLHALDLTSLQDKITPATVGGSGKLTNGKKTALEAGFSRQRPALLETGGNIYAGFGSYCDIGRHSRGWVLGWQAANLAPLEAAALVNHEATAPPKKAFLSSLWMSGYGIASDDNGSLFFVTGNSDRAGTSYDPVNNLEESVVRISADLTSVQGYYTPDDPVYGWSELDQEDNDFGSGGVLLLPPQPGSVPNMAVAEGKIGPMYLLNRDALGGLGGPSVTLGAYAGKGCWCGPSYYVGPDGVGRVVQSAGETLNEWMVVTSPAPQLPQLQLAGSASVATKKTGFFTTISSNGTMAGSHVIWAVGRPVSETAPVVTLQAFDPNRNLLPLFSAPLSAGPWPFKGSGANLVPVVANGHVFVGSYQTLSIFGMAGSRAALLARPKTLPAVEPGPGARSGPQSAR